MRLWKKKTPTFKEKRKDKTVLGQFPHSHADLIEETRHFLVMWLLLPQYLNQVLQMIKPHSVTSLTLMFPWFPAQAREIWRYSSCSSSLSLARNLGCLGSPRQLGGPQRESLQKRIQLLNWTAPDFGTSAPYWSPGRSCTLKYFILISTDSWWALKQTCKNTREPGNKHLLQSKEL